VRQAIVCSIDRALIVRTLMHGHAQPAESHAAREHWAWTGTGPRWEFDQARAVRLLEERLQSGRDGVRLRLAHEDLKST